MKLRPYQEKVVNEIGNENAIVKMPTGSGKTFVAAEFLLRSLIKRGRDAIARSALFLVPTCDLVTQQTKAIKEWVGTEIIIADYFGGKVVPSAFDVLVSTPQAFLTVQQTETSNKWFQWSNFFACVFDEVHHVLKEHPYRIIAHRIKAWEEYQKQRIQIVGLSASLTYAVEHKAVEQALANLCYDLSATRMISPTEDELQKSGYIPNDDSIETMKTRWTVPAGVIPEHERLPHEMHKIFMKRIADQTSTSFATQVYQVVRNIEREIEECDHVDSDDLFISPLCQVKLSSWEDYAHRMKRRFRLGSPMLLLYSLLETWYVALRMVVQSWEEEEQLVLQWLLINDGFQIEGWFSPCLESSLNEVRRLTTINSMQAEKLSSLINKLIDERKYHDISFRCIIFVQQRISAYVLSCYINDHSACNEFGLRAGYVASKNSRITPSLKVTPGEATKCIDDFRQGIINVIVATSVIEEGFDVPEANVVISYDHLKDTVELCQRFGRARQKTSSLSLMAERKDRPLSALKEVKAMQESIIKGFDPTQNQSMTLSSRQQSVRDRERAAFSILKDTARCQQSPMECLNTYRAKTKAVLDINFVEADVDKMFRSKIVYSSSLSEMTEIVGIGEGNTKKHAKNQSALYILNQLRERGIAMYS
jgi:ERCC4-related helicase